MSRLGGATATAVGRVATPVTRLLASDPVSFVLVVAGIYCLAAWFPGSLQIGALALIVGTMPRLRRPVHIAWPLVAFVAWAALSSTWSLSPSSTLAEVVKLGSLALGATLVANTWSLRRVAMALATALGVVSLASLLVLVLTPGAAVEADGALRGVAPHPNSLGFTAALGTLSALSLVFDRSRPRLVWLALSVLNGVTLWLSTSMTALASMLVAATVASVVWFVGTRRNDLRPLTGVGTIAAVGAVAVAVGSNLGALTRLVGRDPTFTGRTDIWALMLSLIAERPMLGYGVGAAWSEESPFRVLVQRELGFAFVSAHNGLLDLALEAGFVGVLLLVPWVTVTLVRCMAAPPRRPGVWWALASGTYLAVANIAETYITHAFAWTVLCVLGTALGRPSATGTTPEDAPGLTYDKEIR